VPKNYAAALLIILLFSPTCWYTYAPLVFSMVALALRDHLSMPSEQTPDPAAA
jgi:hypothetical protein